MAIARSIFPRKRLELSWGDFGSGLCECVQAGWQEKIRSTTTCKQDGIEHHAACHQPGDTPNDQNAHRASLEQQIEGWWCERSLSAKLQTATHKEDPPKSIDGALVCLSVRSGLDLALHSLNLPRGSEVIMSAVTIKHMVRFSNHIDYSSLNLISCVLLRSLPKGAYCGAPWLSAYCD